MNHRKFLAESEYSPGWFVIPAAAVSVEGPAEHWLGILAAMKKRQAESFKRVGVLFDRQGNAEFRSPRNSIDDWEVLIPAADVDEWIARAEALLASKGGAQ